MVKKGIELFYIAPDSSPEFLKEFSATFGDIQPDADMCQACADCYREGLENVEGCIPDTITKLMLIGY